VIATARFWIRPCGAAPRSGPAGRIWLLCVRARSGQADGYPSVWRLLPMAGLAGRRARSRGPASPGPARIREGRAGIPATSRTRQFGTLLVVAPGHHVTGLRDRELTLAAQLVRWCGRRLGRD
jgi:hypothetical protein